MIPPKSNNSDFEFKRMPRGQYPARLFSIVDIGTHTKNTKFGEKRQRLIRLTFEFPTQLETFTPERGEEPFTIMCQFTYSMASSAHLRKFVQSILGKELSDTEAEVFDMESLMGKTILASIDDVKNGDKIFSNIIVCMPLPSAMQCPAPFFDTILYSVENHNESMWKKIHPKIQEKIAAAEEMQIGSWSNNDSKNIHNVGGSKVKIEDVPF